MEAFTGESIVQNKEQKFYWQKSEYSNEDEELRKRWGSDGGSYDETSGRGVPMLTMSRREQGKYLDSRDNFVKEKKEISDGLANIDWENVESCKMVAGLLQKCIRLVNSQYDEDTDDEFETLLGDYVKLNGSEKYVLNEMFVPVLFEIQKNALPANIQTLNEELMKVVRNNFDPESELYLQNKFVGEVLKTTIEIGGVEQVKIVADFIKEEGYKLETATEEKREYTYESQDLEYTYSSELEDLHRSICEGVMLREWDSNQATKVAKMLSETVGLNSWGCLGYYKKTFEYLGINESFPYLIENLRSEDVLTRRMSAEILYSLEVGEITIDNPEGVKYFDKLYMLTKENDPDFFVRLYEQKAYVKRLDRNGRIGVLGANHEILGFFQLDLESKSGKITSEVKELKTKDVFLPKADENEDEVILRKMMMEIFLTNYRETQREIAERTGIELNSLELHEQGWFVAFWTDKKTTDEQKERVARIARKYGDVGIKAFLTLDYGESAESLMEFMESETLGESEKETVLKNYALLLNRSFEWRNFFSETEEGTELNFAAEIHEAIIRKSAEYLQAARIIGSGESTDVTISELIGSMKQIAFTMEKLKGLYSKDSSLVLEQTQYHPGYLIKGDETSMDSRASETWNFKDSKDGSTVSVTVRLVQVYDENGEKFERRVNFKVKNKKLGMEGRIGIDMDTFLERIGQSDREMLSLDVATGKTDFKNGTYGTVETSRILKNVENSQGGHSYASFSKESAERYGEIATTFRDYMKNRFGWIDSWKEKGLKDKAKKAESLPNSGAQLQ